MALGQPYMKALRYTQTERVTINITDNLLKYFTQYRSKTKFPNTTSAGTDR